MECSGKLHEYVFREISFPHHADPAVLPDEGAPPAHAKNYNSCLGISVVGDFDSRDNPKG